MKKVVMIALLLAFAAGSQYFFDLQKKERPLVPLTLIPAPIIKLGDLGLSLLIPSGGPFLERLQDILHRVGQR